MGPRPPGSKRPRRPCSPRSSSRRYVRAAERWSAWRRARSAYSCAARAPPRLHGELGRRLADGARRRKQRGDSGRSIGGALGIHRSTVRGLLKELSARGEQGESALEREMPPPPAHRGSKLDAFAERIDPWLGTYEDLTAVRLYEKLKAEGFAGGYTIVREYLKRLRGRRTPQQAFQVVETPAGQPDQFQSPPYTLPGCGQQAQLWACSLS